MESAVIMSTPPPRRVECRHIVLLMSTSASHQLLREPTAQIFFGSHVFLFSRALPFVFFYDLDLCSQGQAVRAFFIGIGFSFILAKVQGEFDQKCLKTS